MNQTAIHSDALQHSEAHCNAPVYIYIPELSHTMHLDFHAPLKNHFDYYEKDMIY